MNFKVIEMHFNRILEFLGTLLSPSGWWIALAVVIVVLLMLVLFRGIVMQGMRSGREIRIANWFYWKK